MHMDIMTIQPNQGSRSKETQNREISPENADRMQNADFRERHRGNSSPSRSASGTGSIQTIWVRLHRSFAPRQRVFAPKCPPLGREKISRNLLHGLYGRAGATSPRPTPNKSHTRNPRCTALATEALQAPHPNATYARARPRQQQPLENCTKK